MQCARVIYPECWTRKTPMERDLLRHLPLLPIVDLPWSEDELDIPEIETFAPPPPVPACEAGAALLPPPRARPRLFQQAIHTAFLTLVSAGIAYSLWLFAAALS